MIKGKLMGRDKGDKILRAIENETDLRKRDRFVFAPHMGVKVVQR